MERITLKRLAIAVAVVLLVIFLGLYAVAYLYDNSVRAGGLIQGKLALKDAYKHYLEHGYPTNRGNHYQVYTATNVVAIQGTNYQCFLTVEDERFRGQGVLSMTTNEVFIWRDVRGGAKLIPPGYKPPLFPPDF